MNSRLIVGGRVIDPAHQIDTTVDVLIQDGKIAAAPCRIEVVERGSDWPVPLVELRTTHHATFVTDNAGCRLRPARIDGTRDVTRIPRARLRSCERASANAVCA